MTVTVRELIKQLKKMPPEATVIIKYHDHGGVNLIITFVM